MTLIKCRTDREACLVVEQLVAADLIAILPTEQTRNLEPEQDGFLPVQVSTSAYQAATELHDSIQYEVKQASARFPLDGAMKLFAFFLPVPFPAGFIIFVIVAWRFSNRGLERRAHEWAKWFALGLAVWLAVLAVWFAFR